MGDVKQGVALEGPLEENFETFVDFNHAESTELRQEIRDKGMTVEMQNEITMWQRKRSGSVTNALKFEPWNKSNPWHYSDKETLGSILKSFKRKII